MRKEKRLTLIFIAIFICFNLTFLAFIDALMTQIFYDEREERSQFLSQLGIKMYIADPGWLILLLVSIGISIISAIALTLGDPMGYSKEDLMAFIGLLLTTLILFTSGLFDIASASWFDIINHRQFIWPYWKDAWWLSGNPLMLLMAEILGTGIDFHPVVLITSLIGIIVIITYWSIYYLLG